MIKSLLDADKNPPPETQVIIEDRAVNPATGEKITDPVVLAQLADADDLLEIPNLKSEPQNASEIFDAAAKRETQQVEFEKPAAQSAAFNAASEISLFQTGNLNQNADSQSESPAETIRKSGLAYAAAVTLFGSIVFLLILGWLVDLLLGSSPWGIVGGIVLGSIIGFLQFFRLTAQILKNKD